MKPWKQGFSRPIVAILLVTSLITLGSVARATRPGRPPAHPAAALSSAGAADATGDHVPGEILVKFVKRPSRAGIERAKGRVEGRAIKSFPSIRVELWKLETGIPVGRAIAELARSEFADAVAYAEPNWISTLHDLPNDPLLPQLWGLHNIGQTGGTDDADIDALEAWGQEAGSAGVVIAVLDSGIDYLHEDLDENVWVNPDEDLDGVDDDSNGFVDDVRGWDFVNDDNDPLDDHGHGTHTSGTIGAVGNNGVGVCGVNQTVRIMPLKICSAAGFCTTDDQIDALLYAASFETTSGAKVVRITNNSYGGGRRSKTLQDAIEQSGALFVASAGNSGTSRKQYPAGYSLDNIISVAATDHDDQLASFSNYGTSWVDLAAPGVDVVSTVPNDHYDPASGTSMSAPHVAGVAGLVLAHFPSMTNPEIKARILDTVDPLDSLTDRVLTGGRLNAASAVGAIGESDDTAPAAVTDLWVDLPATTHDTVTLTWTAPGDDDLAGTAFLYDLRHASSAIVDDASFALATEVQGEPLPQSSGSAERLTVTGLSAETTYFFALKTSDEAGNVSGLSNSPSATTLPASPTVWTISTVATGGSIGDYLGLAFDAAGQPSVAYSDYPNSAVLFAQWNGSGWDTETVNDREYAGVDLAYGSSGQPTVTYGWGKLYASDRVGSAWERTTVQNNSYNDRTSLQRVPGGDVAVAYRGGGRKDGLNFAERIGGLWDTQLVASGAAARYVALAYDLGANPAIAYSDDPDGDGWLSAIGLARWNGASWDFGTVEEGPVGYGVPTAIAIDPNTGFPVLMHEGTRFLEWDGSAWLPAQILDTESSDVGGAALAFGADGTLYAAWLGDDQLKVATRPPGGGDWQTETVDENAGAFALPLKVSPDGKLYVVYQGTSGSDPEVLVAWKSLP